MKRVKPIERAGWCLMILAAAVPACQSPPPVRDVVQESATADAFRGAEVREIVVLPVATAVPGDVAGGERFPAADMRHILRTFLIQKKNYATPTSAWVDAQVASGGETALETDAVLEVAVEQWELDRLASRGVVYAGATFALKRPAAGETLWSYRCRDLQLMVDGPYGGRETPANMRSAARRLAETALARLPRK